MLMIEQRSDTELLTTAQLLEKTRLQQWKLEYLCKTEVDAVQSLVPRTIPPRSRLWHLEAVDHFLSGHTL